MERIKFTSTCYSTQFGTLTAGDLLTCSAAHAAHFVDELKIADRVALPVPADVAPPEAPVRRRKQS
ncbi:MAG: hypothetical protein LW835_17960 [Burkholderiaceae bacterium]|jgi:hypothetical protein|nr:hypothetical protein [Burkholderiaceae bacterium]